MKLSLKSKFEPRFHLTKRDTMIWWKAWLIRFGFVIGALIVGAIVTMIITKENPFSVYGTMINGAFGSSSRIWRLLQSLAILLCISLAVTPAFKMRFWNIGAEGQVLIGGLAVAGGMIYLGDKLPNAILIPVLLVMAIISGGIWGFIPAFFKANWNTNETLFTLMMNYVAIQLISFFTVKWEVPKGSGTIGIINQNDRSGWMPFLFDNRYLLNVLIVVVITVLIYFYLKSSKHGYEISVVGESENTARYIGINVKKVILRTMILSGALCGVAGFLLVSGTNHTINTTTAGGRGFTAIMVSWLAKFNPLYMVLTAFLLVFLERGANEMATVFRMNQSFADILSGILLFFVIASEFFIQYQVHYMNTRKEEKNV